MAQRLPPARGRPPPNVCSPAARAARTWREVRDAGRRLTAFASSLRSRAASDDGGFNRAGSRSGSGGCARARLEMRGALRAASCAPAGCLTSVLRLASGQARESGARALALADPKT